MNVIVTYIIAITGCALLFFFIIFVSLYFSYKIKKQQDINNLNNLKETSRNSNKDEPVNSNIDEPGTSNIDEPGALNNV